MSATGGGLQHPRDGLHSSSRPTSPSASTDAERPRSPTVLARRLSNIIDLQDPSRVVECSQIERQLHFQHLVRQ